MISANLFTARLLRYYFAFLLIGFFTVMAGPLLPWFAQKFSVTPSQSGTLFFAQFAASTAGALLSGFSPRLASRSGMLFIAVAALAATSGNWPITVAAFAIGGFGFGLAIPVINMAVADETAGDPRALNMLNAFWGLGAFLAPLLLERSSAKDAVLIGFALLTIVGAASLPSVRDAQVLDTAVQKDSFWAVTSFSVVAFLYIGTESTVGGWIPTLAAMGSRSWIPAASAFWGALVAGRLLAPALFGRISARAVLFGGTTVAAISVLALWRFPGNQLFIMAMLAGLSLAPLFPTLIAVYSRGLSKPSAGVCFAIGGMGGAILPWAAGYLASSGTSIRTAFMVPLIGLAALFAMVLAPERRPV
jgi:MFS transporter, FHS family, glucose/mannose:H+ symporter